MKIFADFSFLMRLIIICVILGFIIGIYVSRAGDATPAGAGAVLVGLSVAAGFPDLG